MELNKSYTLYSGLIAVPLLLLNFCHFFMGGGSLNCLKYLIPETDLSALLCACEGFD